MAMQVTYEWGTNSSGDSTIIFTITGMNSSYNTTQIAFQMSGGTPISFSETGYLSTYTITIVWDEKDTPDAGILFTFTHYYTVGSTTQNESASVTVFTGDSRTYTLSSYVVGSSSNPLDEVISISDNIAAYYTYRYSIVFAESGMTTFESYDMTEGVWARLSTSTNFDKDLGMPSSFLAQDYDSSGNISFSFDVRSGVTYFLYVTANTKGDSVKSKIRVYPPGTSGGGETEIPTKWTVTPVSVSGISSNKSYELGFIYGKVIRHSLTFSKSGDVTFYTTGSEIDTVAYFAEASQYSLEFNTTDGSPGEWQYYNDDISSSNRNFSITAPVEANTTYYLYVRGINLESSGTCMLYIEPDFSTSTAWTQTSGVWDRGSDAQLYSSCSLTAGYVYKYTVNFANSGTATFYTTGNIDTYGYLSTSTSFDSNEGAPTNILTSDDNSGSSQNFSFTYEVTGGKDYYLWVRGKSLTTSGSISIYVDLTGSSVDDGAYLALSSTNVTAISVYIRGLDTNYSKSDRTIYWYYGTSNSNYTQSGTSTLSSGVSSSGVYTFNNLSRNTTYYIKAKITYSGGEKELSYITATTDDWYFFHYSDMGQISDTTSRYMNFAIGEVGWFSVSFANSGTATFYTTGSTDTIGTISTSNNFNYSTGWPTTRLIAPVDGGGDGGNFKFTYDVTAGTTYYVWARYYYGSTSCNTTVYVVPPSYTSKPSSFSWTTTKVQGNEFKLTAAEWNALQAKVNEVREYHGLSTYSLTNVVRGNTFYATDYNNVLMAIAGAYSELGTTGIYNNNYVSSGDIITAACLNKLVTLVNELIDK